VPALLHRASRVAKFLVAPGHALLAREMIYVPKNLVICLDGTGAQPRQAGNTNLVRLYSMLDLSDPRKQIAYYDPGVGTFASAGAWTPLSRWFSRMLGLAFGSGLKQNLGEVYTWLMQNWERGDQVFVFGFSRGAYTARALLGLLRTLGLLRPGSENFVPYVVSTYAGNWGDIHKNAEIFAQRVDDEGRTTVPVRYLGVWDTVKAAGFLRRSISWRYTHELPNAQRIRHAVSIDERRRLFREYPIAAADETLREEVWFAGVHSDVGGTFDDDPALSTIALKWIVEQAVAEGMLVRSRKYAAECTVTPEFAEGLVHRMSWAWRFLGERRRPIPTGSRMHTSVRERIGTVTGYDPIGSTNVTWADEDWTTLR
jgi:uncharacterized protein (DUF2235 family)